MVNNQLKCPRCGELEQFKIERSPNGKTSCLNCGYSGLHVEFINNLNKPFIRSELDSTMEPKYWALVLRLATETGYKDLKKEFYSLENRSGTLSFFHVNEHLCRHGYIFIDLHDPTTLDSAKNVRQVLDMFPNLKVVVRTKRKKCPYEPNIHYYEQGTLYTVRNSDDIFKERALGAWVRI